MLIHSRSFLARSSSITTAGLHTQRTGHRALWFSGALSLALTAAGCGSTVACTDQALPSVEVAVFDDMAAPVSDATLTYIGGQGAASGDVAVKACSPQGEGSNVFVCGWEEVGHFRITAVRGADTQTIEVDATLDEGECPHVRTVTADIVLPSH